MAESLYVIAGASGHVGGGAARMLLEAKKKVRVIGRKAENLAPLQKLGAEVAVGNLEDPAFAKQAFAGATAAFLLVPPNFAVQGDFREWQRKLVDNLGQAVEANRPKYVMTLSSIGADVPTGNGPVGGLYDLEQRLNKIPQVNRLHLRPGYFLENFLMNIGMIKAMGANGGAMKADLPLSVIATKDIAQVAGRRLLALDWTGTEVQELRGPKDYTMREVTQALGKAIGKPDLAYQQFPYDAAQKGLTDMGVPESIARGYMEMTRGFNEGALKATQNRDARTNTPTTVEEFAKSVFAPAFSG